MAAAAWPDWRLQGGACTAARVPDTLYLGCHCWIAVASSVPLLASQRVLISHPLGASSQWLAWRTDLTSDACAMLVWLQFVSVAWHEHSRMSFRMICVLSLAFGSPVCIQGGHALVATVLGGYDFADSSPRLLQSWGGTVCPVAEDYRFGCSA